MMFIEAIPKEPAYHPAQETDSHHNKDLDTSLYDCMDSEIKGFTQNCHRASLYQFAICIPSNSGVNPWTKGSVAKSCRDPNVTWTLASGSLEHEGSLRAF